MADRFQKLFSLENNLYIEKAPIIISAAVLLKDNKSGNIVVQIKFKSVSIKNIKGVKISLHAYDVLGKEISGVDDYQYLDLNIPNGESFGSSKAIVMPETTTRSFTIKSITVIFADLSIWENATPNFVTIPNTKLLNSELKNEELIKQYQIETTNKANYIPDTYLNLWTCCCGELNSEEYCTNCGINKNNTFSKYNITDLTEAMNLRLDKEKEERLALERQNENIRKETKRKNKRVSIISAIVFLIVAGIMTSFIIINTMIIPNYKVEKLKVVKVGDYVSLGAYEQDNNTSNGKEDVEWLVLDVQDGKALLISKHALDCKQYNTSYTDVTWETCTLRKWLNSDFINAVFSADEKAIIPMVTVTADKNPEYSTDPGNATQDQVFLLSITEVNKYFSSDSARVCKTTDCAVAGGAYVNSYNGYCRWWLRTPCYSQDNAAYVNCSGAVVVGGDDVDDDDFTVRPALWIDLNA